MKKNLFKTLLFVFMIFVFNSVVYADDKPKFEIRGAEVKVGQEFDIPISVTNGDVDTLTNYSIPISYDSNKLELMSSSGLSGGKITNAGTGEVAKLHFKAKSDGNAVIGFDLKNATLSINDNEITSDLDKNATFNSGTITIRALSDDATLKSLKIPNSTLEPEFKSDVYSYKTTVTDVTSIDIDAKTNNGGASVSITPNYKQLVKGEQDVSIVVTSETGSTVTYTIKVTLKLTPTEAELKLADATLKLLAVKGEKIEFNSDEKKYYLTVDYDTTKLNVTAKPTNEKADVKITGDDKLLVGKNTIRILVTSEDKSKIETYQIIVTRNEEEKEIVKTCPDETSTSEWIVFTVCNLFTFTLGIVLGYFLCKKEVLKKLFKKRKKVEEPVSIETLSDTIDLTDTVKQAKQETKK